MNVCARAQVSQRRWIRFLPFWFRGAAGSEGTSAARPLCRSASPALPAPVSGLCVPAANVWGGLLFPDQQLCPFLLPDAQLHQRATSSVDGQHKHCSPVFFQSCWGKMTFVIHLMRMCVCAYECVKDTGTGLTPVCQLLCVIGHRKLKLSFLSVVFIDAEFLWGALWVDSTKVRCWNEVCEVA